MGRRARPSAHRPGAHAVSAPLEDMAAVTRLWAQLRVPDRARYMERIAQAVIDEFEDLCLALAGESQRPRAEIAALELLPAVDVLNWLGAHAQRLLGAHRFALPRALHPLTRASAGHAPVGVVGITGAPSAPFAEPLAVLGTALLAGNGAILAPAVDGALAAQTLELGDPLLATTQMAPLADPAPLAAVRERDRRHGVIDRGHVDHGAGDTLAREAGERRDPGEDHEALAGSAGVQRRAECERLVDRGGERRGVREWRHLRGRKQRVARLERLCRERELLDEGARVLPGDEHALDRSGEAAAAGARPP